MVTTALLLQYCNCNLILEENCCKQIFPHAASHSISVVITTTMNKYIWQLWPNIILNMLSGILQSFYVSGLVYRIKIKWQRRCIIMTWLYSMDVAVIYCINRIEWIDRIHADLPFFAFVEVHTHRRYCTSNHLELPTCPSFPSSSSS